MGTVDSKEPFFANINISDSPVWRFVCTALLGVYLAGCIILLVIVLEVLAGVIRNPLQHEEGRYANTFGMES